MTATSVSGTRKKKECLKSTDPPLQLCIVVTDAQTYIHTYTHTHTHTGTTITTRHIVTHSM